MAMTSLGARIGLVAVVAAVTATYACASDGGASPTPTTSPIGSSMPAALTLISDAFPDNATIPDEFTCNGRNVSPPLRWSDVPAGARSLVLIVDDPDAPRGTFDHWIVYDLPAATTGLPAAAAVTDGKVGRNSAGASAYTGPCPPAGADHHYRFKLYALDTQLDLAAGASKGAVEAAMRGHLLGQATLVGVYRR